jgi:hypothetical protein
MVAVLNDNPVSDLLMAALDPELISDLCWRSKPLGLLWLRSAL